MPTPLPPSEKTAFINIVRHAPIPIGGPSEADRLEDILNNYEDIYTAITRQLELFAINNNYLLTAISVFDQLAVQSVGIWINQTVASPPLTDPVLIINSTYEEVILSPSSPPGNKSLCLLGTTFIGNIVLEVGTTLDNLYIGPGCTVDLLDSTQEITDSPPTQATVETVFLPYLKSTPSKLNAVKYESVVNQVIVDEGSYYGGVQSNDPDLVCTDIVTSITATETTKNGVMVSWTKPANYLFITVDYRKTGSNVWIPVTEKDGDFQPNDTGFAFRMLQPDTFYDVRINSQCTNGGWGTNQITFQTVCCGAGTMLSLYKNCPITMLISSVADSPPLGQILCNGVAIDLHYPPGTTITIPYLATVNCAVLEPFVIDNANYQNVPFNKATGTWSLLGTSIGGVNEGSVVTVNVSIPA